VRHILCIDSLLTSFNTVREIIYGFNRQSYVLVIVLAGLAGCASMNKSECLNATQSNQAQLDKLKKDIKAKEALLVSSKTSEMTRVHLLEEIKTDEKKVEELEKKVLILERDKEEKLAEYEEIKKMYQY